MEGKLRGAELPEEIFLNYVLFHRVNEEEIAPCRTFFRREIGERTEGMSFREAALEVNYWCAQEATYHCTDDRTLSALAVYRRGNGRCGEESVFTVNALRSVGVPAVRYMHQSGLIVMTIMRGWKSGAMEAGIFWEPVSRRRS